MQQPPLPLLSSLQHQKPVHRQSEHGSIKHQISKRHLTSTAATAATSTARAFLAPCTISAANTGDSPMLTALMLSPGQLQHLRFETVCSLSADIFHRCASSYIFLCQSFTGSIHQPPLTLTPLPQQPPRTSTTRAMPLKAPWLQ